MAETTTPATPEPWRFEADPVPGHIGGTIFAANNEPVMFDDDPALLKRIVRAVNAHDALVRALQNYFALHGEHPLPCHCTLCDNARAALRAATDEEA